MEINHITYRGSQEYRLVRLGAGFLSWRRRILNIIWNDHVQFADPIEIAHVRPDVTDGSDGIVAHVVIIQQPLPAFRSCILAVTELWGDPWHPRLLCNVLPDRGDSSHLLQAAGVMPCQGHVAPHGLVMFVFKTMCPSSPMMAPLSL